MLNQDRLLHALKVSGTLYIVSTIFGSLAGAADDIFGFMLVPAVLLGIILYTGISKRVVGWITALLIGGVFLALFLSDPSIELGGLLIVAIIPLWLIVLGIGYIINAIRLKQHLSKNTLHNGLIVTFFLLIAIVLLGLFIRMVDSSEWYF